MPNGDEAHAGLVVDRIDGVVHLHAGQAEDDLDALTVERADESLPSGHLHGESSFR